MRTAATIAQARALFGALPRPLGFVPTMGALHEGHLALVHAARARCSSVGVSVFVNPLQFGATEDLARYPRNLDADRKRLQAAGVDALFAPDAREMYPSDFATFVEVGRRGNVYEGVIRPAHFRGVATVVAKLLNITRPDVLVLGQKDAQQTAVLQQMVRDLDAAVEVAIVPTVREPDGLAMSSRNAYLSTQERAQAPTLHRALLHLRAEMERGADKSASIAAARSILGPLARAEYFDVVDARTFEPVAHLDGGAFVIAAARFGATRLIDNLYVACGDPATRP